MHKQSTAVLHVAVALCMCTGSVLTVIDCGLMSLLMVPGVAAAAAAGVAVGVSAASGAGSASARATAKNRSTGQ